MSGDTTKPETPSEFFATVTRTHSFNQKQMRDFLSAAMEGGINYWAAIKEFGPPSKPIVLPESQFGSDKRVYRHIDYPMSEDGYLVILDTEGEREYRLNREKLVKGLQTFAEKCPKHFDDMISENYDACTADCYIQCCLLGDVVYG